MTIYELDRSLKGIGIAYIINNLHFEQSQTQYDVTNLENMFKTINVKVESVKVNQDKEELEKFAKNLQLIEMNSLNIFFLVVISHGLKGITFIKCRLLQKAMSVFR